MMMGPDVFFWKGQLGHFLFFELLKMISALCRSLSTSWLLELKTDTESVFTLPDSCRAASNILLPSSVILAIESTRRLANSIPNFFKRLVKLQKKNYIWYRILVFAFCLEEVPLENGTMFHRS